MSKRFLDASITLMLAWEVIPAAKRSESAEIVSTSTRRWACVRGRL